MKSIGGFMMSLWARLLPVDNKCVYVFNILDGFNDSVKYIVQEFHKRHPDYKIIWDCSKSMEMTDVPHYIIQVKRSSIKATYYQMRAKLCLDSYIGIHTWMYAKENVRKRLLAELKLRFIKKSDQLHISTFHGVPYKYIGAKRYGDQIKNYAFTTSCDYLILGNQIEEKMYREAYPGNYKFLFLGKANTDILFETAKQGTLKKKLGLPTDKKLFLYAPTYRDWCVEGGGLLQMKQIDIPNLLHTLHKKYGGEWIFGFRVHHYVQEQMKKEEFIYPDDGTILDCNLHDDMAEYMSCCDAFMTDYSSSVLDLIHTDKPCYLYANDEKEYLEKRGGLYFSLNDFPYPIVHNNQELLEAVLDYDSEKINLNREHFLEHLGNVSDGHSSRRIVDFIDTQILK